MKSISASIIVLSGALLLLGGSFISHDQTQLFVHLVGGAVGVLGLGVWIWSISKEAG